MPDFKSYLAGIAALFMGTAPVLAQEVWITQELPFVELEVGQEFFVIERDQDNLAVVPADFAKTSRPCPPFCVQPMTVAEGVNTVGELELIAFLEDVVQAGDGYLIDSRTPRWYEAGTIPGSINIPFNLLSADAQNPFLAPLLKQLGGAQTDSGDWTFDNAPELTMFCNGSWCGQSPRAIRNLLSVGYPAEKLHYYRGGMQNWLILGLNVVIPES